MQSQESDPDAKSRQRRHELQYLSLYNLNKGSARQIAQCPLQDTLKCKTYNLTQGLQATPSCKEQFLAIWGDDIRKTSHVEERHFILLKIAKIDVEATADNKVNIVLALQALGIWDSPLNKDFSDLTKLELKDNNDNLSDLTNLETSREQLTSLADKGLEDDEIKEEQTVGKPKKYMQNRQAKEYIIGSVSNGKDFARRRKRNRKPRTMAEAFEKAQEILKPVCRDYHAGTIT
ncbi:hypothetical protein C8R45DRAFT_943860 [Mycena sanguinolenta]|nr:hypothetical protein C8R45DRAFT_943860 [Mycena sanguinolenta]